MNKPKPNKKEHGEFEMNRWNMKNINLQDNQVTKKHNLNNESVSTVNTIKRTKRNGRGEKSANLPHN